MDVVTGEAEVGIQIACEFDPSSKWVVIVLSADNSIGIDQFPHAAKLIAGIVELVARTLTQRVLLPLGKIAHTDSSSAGSFFTDLRSAPHKPFVAGYRLRPVPLQDADAPPQAVVGEFRPGPGRGTADGHEPLDGDQTIRRIPFIRI